MQITKAVRDYRFYLRMPMPLQVELRMMDERLGRFRVRNIDMGGLFIEAGAFETDYDLYPNDMVEIVFVFEDETQTSRNFRARVVRRVPDGVGLMFLEYDQASLGALLDVMVAANEYS